MTTRYQQLRKSIVRLAATAGEQHVYLESILGHLSSNGDATGYGNNELALEFGEIYAAAAHMQEWGEITEEEIRAVMQIDTLLNDWGVRQSEDFWRREALWSDPRWEQLRQCARSVLSKYPDEERPSGWMNDVG